VSAPSRSSTIEQRLMFAALAVGGAVAIPFLGRYLPRMGFIFLVVFYGFVILAGLSFAKAWGCIGGLVAGGLLLFATHSPIMAVLATTVGWMIEVGRVKRESSK
jgi:hypothetical protein